MSNICSRAEWIANSRRFIKTKKTKMHFYWIPPQFVLRDSGSKRYRVISQHLLPRSVTSHAASTRWWWMDRVCVCVCLWVYVCVWYMERKSVFNQNYSKLNVRINALGAYNLLNLLKFVSFEEFISSQLHSDRGCSRTLCHAELLSPHSGAFYGKHRIPLAFQALFTGDTG